MNMSSASYVHAQPSRGSCDLVTDYHVPRDRGQNRCHRSPEIMLTSERMAASDYSDAGDTLPSYSTADDSDAVPSSHHGDKDVVASREFILKRFLPAAQAMTATDRKSSAPTPSIPSQHRFASVPKYSSFGTRTRRSRPLSFESVSSGSKSRFIREVKQDVTGFSDDEDEERFSAVCGFPLHLGRLPTLQFRCSSFWMSSRSGCRGSRARRTPHKVESVKAVVQDDSDNSDDLFWSDEEVFEDAVKAPELHATPCSDARKGPFTAPPARLHSLQTIHTKDHRGFLGVPSRSHSGSEMERATRQVDRLGARLTRMRSKTNCMESSRNYNMRHVNDVQCEGAGPGSSSATSAAAEKKSRRSSSSSSGGGSKWVDAVASLRPPPSPKMPSESWLSSTLPPERFLMVKKPLRSFIPIQPPLKPPSEEENGDLLRHVRQTCSLKEHMHGR